MLWNFNVFIYSIVIIKWANISFQQCKSGWLSEGLKRIKLTFRWDFLLGCFYIFHGLGDLALDQFPGGTFRGRQDPSSIGTSWALASEEATLQKLSAPAIFVRLQSQQNTQFRNAISLQRCFCWSLTFWGLPERLSPGFRNSEMLSSLALKRIVSGMLLPDALESAKYPN